MAMTRSRAALKDSTALTGNANALRAAAEQEGYLLIRNLLPRDDVDRVGAELAKVMSEAGWIDAEAPLAVARANPAARCVEPQPAFMEVFYAQLALQSLHALKAHDALMQMFEDLFDETPFGVPHCVTRMAIPDMDAYATPAHQDYVHFEGSQRNWPDDRFQYYWQDLPLTIEPFSFQWYHRRDRLAIEMGEAGNPEAAVALENITLKHRDARMRERASAALAKLQRQHTT